MLKHSFKCYAIKINNDSRAGIPAITTPMSALHRMLTIFNIIIIGWIAEWQLGEGVGS